MKTTEAALTEPEINILSVIKDKKKFRNEVAALYAQLIHFEMVNGIVGFKYEVINKAIIERWSVSGLIYIKEKAWKLSANLTKTKP